MVRLVLLVLMLGSSAVCGRADPRSGGDADVVDATTVQADDGTWTFRVTVRHADRGWKDYADGWDVVLPDGTVVKRRASDAFTRVLGHPHVNEQPFTRSQSGLTIPDGVAQVTVRAHERPDGFGGQTQTVTLPGRAPAAAAVVLEDFESNPLPPTLVPSETVLTRIQHGEGHALRAVFPAAALYKNLRLTPVQPWDWSAQGPVCLAVDVRGDAQASAQLFITVRDAAGGALTAHANVGPGAAGTFFLDLDSAADEPGLKGLPHRVPAGLNPLDGQADAFRYAWGARRLDTTQISWVQLYTKGNLTDRTLVFDNLRVVPAPDGATAPLTGLVDALGQHTAARWPGKAAGPGQLSDDADREAQALNNARPLPDRSRFGGWKDGPTLEATGYFRVDRHAGRWTLVDPDGRLFFATGIANARLDNTYTVTGRADGRVVSALRRDMFTWLPEADDPLAAHYGHAQNIHTGAVPAGETFSFYAANLQRKYGRADDPDGLKRWRKTTLDRMTDWGFTGLGNWADPAFYGNGRVAYFAHGWVQGPHARLKGSNDYWAPIHDPFDPRFVQSVREAVDRVAAQVAGDPWCVGVFIDNELSWGTTSGDAGRYGLVINALKQDAAKAPAKAALSALLREAYTGIDALNADWGTAVASWDAFDRGFAHDGELSDGQQARYAVLSEAIADRYFATVKAELRRAMPHHLYLGSRFADWGMTPEAVDAAARHCDVVSYNLYTEGMPGHLADTLARTDRPGLLGEFHFGAVDRGMFHGGIGTAADQADRGVKYAQYVNSAIDHPALVGAHWFQYIDSPTTGRAIDGENYNSGFVSTTDRPYPELVEAARRVNRGLYPRRFGAAPAR